MHLFVSKNLFKLLCSVLAVSVTVACSKEVTNYVQAPNSSTPQTTREGDSANPRNSGSGGGVINGGGGKGVLCKRIGGSKLEILDLYEARTLYNLDVVDVGNDEDKAKDKLAALLAKHLWNPYTIEIDKYAAALKEILLKNIIGNIRFVESGKRLKLVDDSYEPMIEDNCELVQIAMYYDESVLLIDKRLWDQLNWTNRVALLAHETFYFFARQTGVKNSMGTRKLVGQMFSTKGARPVADGVPTDRNKFIDCRVEANGFARGHFFLFPNKAQNGNDALSAVFFDLGMESVLFRMSADFQGVSVNQILNPDFRGTFESTLTKETYPAKDKVQLKLMGISDGVLKAELNILQTVSATPAANYEVNCQVPSQTGDITVKDMEPGRFEKKSGGESTDILVINADRSMTLEHTRQVGGPGGFSRSGVVPYPTVCRYRERATVVSRDEKKLEYEVFKIELLDLAGLSDSKHCPAFVDAFNRRTEVRGIRYTLDLSGFSKVN